MVTAEKVQVKLTSTDGNAFSVIGKVSKALKTAGQNERATEWANRAMKSDSYDALLQLAFEYANIS